MKILIVDDDKENLYMLETLLRGQGYEVESAADGMEALKKTSQAGFDMIISDILMPRMDGFQLCREVKTNEKLKNITFVFYTATYIDPKDEEFALSLGAEKFIVKPAEPDVFMEVLREVIRNYKTETLVVPKPPVEEETVYLKTYNERLVRKLEDKMLQLQSINKALGESERKYRELIDNANDAVIVVDATGHLSFANPKFCRMTGYSIEEVKKLHFSKLVHPEDLALVTENFSKRLDREDAPVNYESRALTKAGETIYVDYNFSSIRREGEIVGVLGIVRDVTERKQLQNASERYNELEDIVNHSPVVVFLWRAAEGWPVELVSDNVQQFGYRSEDFYSGRILFSDIVHPDDLDRINAEVARYNQEGREDFVQEYRIITNTGEVRWLDDRTLIKRDSNGMITHYQGIVLDITKRKRAEDALRKSEASLAEAQRIAHLGSWNWNIETNEMFWSEEIYRIFGLSPEKFDSTYEAFLNSVHPGDRELVKKFINDTLYKKSPHNIEHRIVRPDGEVRVVDERAEVTVDKAGRPIQMIGIDHDITELSEYRERLENMVEERTRELNRALYDTEQARDRMDGILKSVADGLIVTDIDNRIILMNRAAEDLLGVCFSEVMDRPIGFAIEDKTLRERMKTTLNKKESDYQFDFELPGEKEHPRIMRARTSVIEDKSGKQTGIVTVIHDVTYEREVDRMKTEFITTAAHELRTPLTSIQGFSEILLTRDDIKEEEKEECLSYINKQSVNLAAIINDLLDISRIESGKGFSLNKVPADIAGIIRDVVPYFQTLSPKHRFDIIVPEEPVELMVDEEKMRQVLENLLSNAVKYSPEGGDICLTVKRITEFGVRNADSKKEKCSAIEISIADQGIGMSPEQVEKIFDKFYRGDTSNTAIPGTGLGMNIVKYIVEAHGGKVWVESELGKETVVTFAIPAT